MNSINKPVYIVSYWNFKDETTLVGGLRPFKFYEHLKSKKVAAYLVTRKKDLDNSEGVVVEEGFLINKFKFLIKPFPPDHSIFWSINVYRHLKKINKGREFYVFTTSPPNGIHFLGYLLKLFSWNCTWISDYRDLWTQNPLYKPPITKKYFDPFLEKEFLKKADIVVFNTKGDLEFNLNLHPHLKGKAITIRNGFDKIKINTSEHNYKFIYAGGTTGGQATVKIAELLQSLNQKGINATCDFYGEYDKEMDKRPFIKYHGVIHPEEVPDLLCKYKFGFIFLPVHNKEGGRVAQKFYDYIGCGVIPVCFNSSMEMIELIQQINTGYNIDHQFKIGEFENFLKNAKFNVTRDQQLYYTRNFQFDILTHFITDTTSRKN